MNEAALENTFSAEERQALTARLFALLGTQAKRYCSGESTSIPAETARELLESLLHTLRLALSEDGRPERELLTAGLEPLLRRGQTVLQEKTAAAQRLWERACLTAPRLRNVYFEETLTEAGRFFRRYDLWYFAHRVPCALDYPLCLPPPETLRGVSYLEAWLRALCAENELLGRLPAAQAEALLERRCRNYREYPLNLCEPPMEWVLGTALLEQASPAAEISAADAESLRRKLEACGDLPAALDRAAGGAAVRLGVSREAAAYLRGIAAALVPRLESALAAGTETAVFFGGQLTSPP